MIERTISQSMYDKAPLERAIELDNVKETIYHEHIDNLTCRMTRKKSLGEWTDADQVEYEVAQKKCQELIAIEEAKPLFDPNEKLIVVSDKEYEKLLKEEQEQQK